MFPTYSFTRGTGLLGRSVISSSTQHARELATELIPTRSALDIVPMPSQSSTSTIGVATFFPHQTDVMTVPTFSVESRSSFYGTPPFPAQVTKSKETKVKLQKLRYRPLDVYSSSMATLIYRKISPEEDILTIRLDRRRFHRVHTLVEARSMVRDAFDRCSTVKDVLKLLATCMQRRITSLAFASVAEDLPRALFRTRSCSSDPRICSAIRLIIKRLDIAGLPVTRILPILGLKFAARSRSIELMKWFLVYVRQKDLAFARKVFRDVIAKLSINQTGPGSIRNGSWNIRELRQVLHGFKGAVGLEAGAHVGSYLLRHRWQQMRPWLQILVAASDKEGLWHEWLIWRKSKRRLSYWARNSTGRITQMDCTEDRCRGDILFIRSLYWVEAYELAWDALLDATRNGTMSPGQLRNLFLEATERDLWRRDRKMADLDSASLLEMIADRWREKSMARDLRSKLLSRS